MSSPAYPASRAANVPWPEILLVLVLVAAPFVLPSFGFSYDLLQRILDWGLIGLGFDLLFGAAGLLSFGQAAFFGTGGFVSAWLLTSHTLGSVWLALGAGTFAAGVVGLAVGWFAVRRIGIYFAMITLAFGQMAFFLENSPLAHYTGGENGLPGIPVPTLAGHPIAAGVPLYWLLAVIFLAAFVLARRIVHSPFGMVLHALRQNAARAGMVGHAINTYKLAVFVIAALYAGLAGGLLGVLQSYMPPDAFALDTSGQLVVQTVIGGSGTLIGPLVGATLWLWLRDNLQQIPHLGALWKLVLGLIFVALIVVLKRGIAGEIGYLLTRRRTRATAALAEETASDPMQSPDDTPIAAPTLALHAPMLATSPDTPALRAVGLSKFYGGLHAVEDVSFDVRQGSIHAVIGPNGAGKSTLFKMLTDEVPPTAGQVQLFGRRVTGLGSTRTAQLGIAKSNQLNQLFLDMTVEENLRIAALARARGLFRTDLWRAANSLAPAERQVAAVIETVGLGHRAGVLASVLPYGEKRRLEIGIALATGPNLLLLDEPLAGMSPAERVATRALVREIARTRTLVVVEHDMDAIFELAERITVLYEGRLLAEGTPTQIQRNQAVQDAYLGGFHEHEPA